MTSGGFSGWLARLGTALATSVVVSVVVAAVDAGYALEGAPSVHAFVAELGLVAPLGLVVAAFTASAAWLLLPPEFPRLGHVVRAVRAAPAGRRRELSACIIVAVVGGLVGLVVATRVALHALAGGDTPRASGAVLGLVAVGLAVVVTASAAGAGVLAEEHLEKWSPDPLRIGAGAAAFTLCALALLVAFGTTSGSGGPLAVFGVFRREELDLRAPVLALGWLGSALFVPPFARPRQTLALAGVAVTLALLALGHAAASGFDRKTALAVERHAPLGKLLLAAARRATDRDHDGASAWFGDGDCAEGNAAVGPSADDVPGNGIDEDCSGSDAAPVVAPSAAPVAALDTAGTEFVHDHLPKRPNVMLVTIDATRAELGFLGYSRKISPRLDELAKKSAVFENAYSLASYTSKSLAPMLIGHYGSETHRGWLHFNRFTREDVFVSERLQKAGIRTVSVQGHWYFFKNYGMERGYDLIDNRATPADQPIEGDRTSNGDLLSDRVIAELERPELETQQFFLWTHYIDPHAEYVPTRSSTSATAAASSTTASSRSSITTSGACSTRSRSARSPTARSSSSRATTAKRLVSTASIVTGSSSGRSSFACRSSSTSPGRRRGGSPCAGAPSTSCRLCSSSSVSRRPWAKSPRSTGSHCCPTCSRRPATWPRRASSTRTCRRARTTTRARPTSRTT